MDFINNFRNLNIKIILQVLKYITSPKIYIYIERERQTDRTETEEESERLTDTNRQTNRQRHNRPW